MLKTVRIYDREPELRLPLKNELRNVPIFRRANQNVYGYRITSTPITLPIMSFRVRKIGELVGYKNNTICYSLRYIAGSNLDQSSSRFEI
ncbi:hypothetical protein GGR51DRAFT_524401 [Nemania sp. FL0031]|nr:hypothetical protein GGR51DRAFT_524401 [Nemania sp. FL0031]